MILFHTTPKHKCFMWFLLATVAFAGENKNFPNLRGKLSGVDDPQAQAGARLLRWQESSTTTAVTTATATTTTLNIANLAIGDMECEEAAGGSVVCAFRTVLPTSASNLNTGSVLVDCLRQNGSNSQYCVTTEVYRSSYQSIPEPKPQPKPEPKPKPPINPSGGPGSGINPNIPRPEPIQNVPDVPNVPSDPAPPQVPPVTPAVMLRADGCPEKTQLTGVRCDDFVPPGASETYCNYFSSGSSTILRCGCTLRVGGVPARWVCGAVEEAEEEPPLAVSLQPPAPIGGISANVQSVVVPPPDPPGQILPTINNPAYCADTEAECDGASCYMHQRCTYYVLDEETGDPTGANECGCDPMNGIYKCYKSPNPIFNP